VLHLTKDKQAASQTSGAANAALIRGSEGEVARTVGNKFMAEGLANFRAVNKKNACHSPNVAAGHADNITVCPRVKHAIETRANVPCRAGMRPTVQLCRTEKAAGPEK